MKIIVSLFILLALVPSGRCADFKVFFGNLHSHTAYSDGSGTPDEAYRYARDKAKLDFLAITEHNHRSAETAAVEKNNDSIAHHHDLYNGPQSGSVVNAARRFTVPGKFVSLYGQEFSTIKGGNHVNVFEVGEVIDEQLVNNKRFDQLLTWLQSHPDSQGGAAILQLNHPDTPQRKAHEEYGADDFASLQDWQAKMSQHVRLISIQNGPSHDGAINKPARLDTVDDYLAYLSLGFKLGPTCDQDNHHKNWGQATRARTAVITDELTKPKVLAALRSRHVYATQDQNLRIVIFVEGRLCGDVVDSFPAPNSDLKIEYTINDDDEPDADYEIEVWGGRVGGEPAKRLFPALHVHGNNAQLRPIEEIPFPGENHYILFRVVQDGEHETDDIAWTAPVWFEQAAQPLAILVQPEATGTFIASVNSPIYHISEDCRSVALIKAVNRVTGLDAKRNRVAHTNCPVH